MDSAIAIDSSMAAQELKSEAVVSRNLDHRTTGEGVPGNTLQNLVQLIGNEEPLVRMLGLAPAEFDRLQDHETLTAEQGERVLEVIQLYLMALQICKNTERTMRWLNTSCPLLGGCTPVEMFETVEQRQTLKELLHGILAGELDL